MKINARYLSLSCCLILLILIGCKSKLIQLWNEKDFSGWKLIVADNEMDGNNVWSIRNEVIYCKGIPKGYMRTESEYSNYILHIDWRWVEKEGNSGVLLHIQEPDQVWPFCFECQLKSGKAGDFVLIGEGSIDVDGQKYINSKKFLVIPKRQESNENSIGKWNSYKIVCKNDKITCYVNGVLQNKGTHASRSGGKIGLQSEGAPIEFRNIRLELLN
jgi:hypothetical protein